MSSRVTKLRDRQDFGDEIESAKTRTRPLPAVRERPEYRHWINFAKGVAGVAPGRRGRHMSDLDALPSVPTNRTPLGFKFIVMASVPEHLRNQCWAWLSERNARLFVDGVGASALLQDWHQWLDSLSDVSR